MQTYNSQYGTGKDSTSNMTRIGRKTQIMEREIERQVA